MFNEDGTMKSWDEVRSDFERRYPGVPVDQMRSQYENARSMRQARIRFAAGEETPEDFVGQRSIPFVSTGANLLTSEIYRRAQARVQSGQAESSDYDTVARFERLREIDQERSLGGQIGAGIAHVPAMIGEAIVGGAVVGGASPALGNAPSLLSRAAYASPGALGAATARVGAMTALTPSMYVPGASERAISQGGEAYSPQNLGPAFLMGFAQTAILGSLGGVGESIQGSGAGAFAKRLAARTFTGMVEQQGVDLLAGAIDNVLPEAYRTNTGYGLLGSAFRDEWGEAGKHAAVQAATFAAFSALHPFIHGERQPQTRQAPHAGAEAVQRGPAEPAPEPARSFLPEGVRGAIGTEGRQHINVEAPVEPNTFLGPRVVLDAYAEAMNRYKRMGLTKEAASKRISAIMEAILNPLKERGNLTQEEVADIVKGLKLSGPSRDFADVLVDVFEPYSAEAITGRSNRPLAIEEAARRQPVAEQPVAENIPAETPQSRAPAPQIAPEAPRPETGLTPAEVRPEAVASQPEPIPAPSVPDVSKILTPREQKIVEARMEGRSVRDIGREFGVTGSRIEQIERRALEKLREATGAVGAEGSINTEVNAPGSAGERIALREKAALLEPTAREDGQKPRTMTAMETLDVYGTDQPAKKLITLRSKLNAEMKAAKEAGKPILDHLSAKLAVELALAEKAGKPVDPILAKYAEVMQNSDNMDTLYAPGSTPTTPPTGQTAGMGQFNLRATINSLFGMAEYVGKTTQAAAAEYATRARQLITSGMMVGETPTQIHELAHHLATHPTKGIDLDPARLPPAVKQGFREFDYIPNRPNLAVAMQEGFAEFLRMRVTQQLNTSNMTPEMAQAAIWAEQALIRKGYGGKLTRVTEAYANMAGQSPADLARGMASPTGKAPSPTGLTATEGMVQGVNSLPSETQRLLEHRLLPADQLTEARREAGMPDLLPGQSLSATIETAQNMPTQWASQMATEGVIGIERGPDGKWRQSIISEPVTKIVEGIPQEYLQPEGASITDAAKRFVGLPVSEKASWLGTFILGRNVVDKFHRGVQQSTSNNASERMQGQRNIQAVSESQLKAYNAFLEDVQVNNPALYQKAMDAYQKYTAYTDALLQARVMDGTMTAKQAMAWRKAEANHVSLARIMEDGGYTIAVGAERHGSGRQLVDPFVTLQERINIRANEMYARLKDSALLLEGQHQGSDQVGVANMFREVKAPQTKDAALINVENRMKEAGYSQADINAVTSLIGVEYILEKPWKDDSRNLYTARVAGKDHVFEFGSKPLYDLVANRVGANSDNRLVSATAKIVSLPGMKQMTEFLKFGATTAKMTFNIRNPVRDPWQYAMNVMGRGRGFMQDVMNFLKGHQTAFAEKARKVGGFDYKDPIFKMYDEGGGESLRGPYSFAPVGKAEEAWRVVRGESGGLKDKTIRVLEKTKDVLEMIGAGEHGPRFAEYKNTLLELGYTEAQIKASLNASPNQSPITLTDHMAAMQRASRATVQFSRQGELTHELNKIVPFMTPAIAGISQEARNWAGAYKEMRSGVFGPKSKGMIGAIGVYLGAELLHNFLFKDEDWYKELPEHLRYNWWIVGKNSEGGVWGIPKPQGIIRMIGAFAQEALRSQDADPRFDMLAQNAYGQVPRMLPIGIGETVDVARNVGWDGRPIVPVVAQRTESNFDQWMRHRIPYLSMQLTGGLFSPQTIRPPWEAFTSTRADPNQSVADYYERLQAVSGAREAASREGRRFEGERDYRVLHAYERHIQFLGQQLRGERRAPNGRVIVGERPGPERTRELRRLQTELAKRAIDRIN